MAERDEPVRLLFVDDEGEFLDAVVPGMERRGFRVARAGNGKEALRLLERHPFELVVLDVKMPGMDGVSVFRRIRETAPALPVIMLTGHGSLHQAFETSREGVFEYLLKPCDVDVLAKVAHRAVERAAVAEEDVRAVMERVLAERPD